MTALAGLGLLDPTLQAACRALLDEYPGLPAAPGAGAGRQQITGEPQLQQVRQLLSRLERSGR